nr:type II secretion system F family protein [Candidatus Paceibacterota bacterium]
MPSFTYKALRKEDNVTYEATVEAKDRFEIYSLVRKDGAQVLSVRETSRGISFTSIDIGKLFSRVSGMDRVLITRNMGAMLHAGLTVTRALSVIERQTRKAKLKEILHTMSADIEKGAQLSDAMKKHPKAFPSIVTAMVRAGEESGTLSDTLRTISEQLEQSVELQKKVMGAMLYPSIIISVLLIIGALMLVFIVPTLTSTFTSMGVELPMSTQFIIALSDFLIAHTLIALVLVIAAITGGVLALRTPTGKHTFETVFLHTPILGILMKEVNSARTGRTL